MGGKEKTRICKQYSTKKIEDWESCTKKIKRKAHVKQSFYLDFLERGTFTEYPYLKRLSCFCYMFFTEFPCLPTFRRATPLPT